MIGLMQVTKALLPGADRQRRRGDPQRRARPPAGSPTRAAAATPPPSTAPRWSPRRCASSCATSRCGSARSRPAWCRTDEFALVRFDGDQAKADAVYDGVAEPLTADDVADAITWMVTRPAHVNIDELVIRPRAQAAQHKVHRVGTEDAQPSSSSRASWCRSGVRSCSPTTTCSPSSVEAVDEPVGLRPVRRPGRASRSGRAATRPRGCAGRRPASARPPCRTPANPPERITAHPSRRRPGPAAGRVDRGARG